MNENELSREIIGAAIETHKELGGPGLIEDIYEVFQQVNQTLYVDDDGQ